jgi:hypothetical protein
VDQIPALFLALIVMIAILLLGGVFSEPITALIHRRLPGFSYEGDRFLLWGLLIIAAFAFGLMVMYLLLRP